MQCYVRLGLQSSNEPGTAWLLHACFASRLSRSPVHRPSKLPEQADLQGGALGAFQALSESHGKEQRWNQIDQVARSQGEGARARDGCGRRSAAVWHFRVVLRFSWFCSCFPAGVLEFSMPE